MSYSRVLESLFTLPPYGLADDEKRRLMLGCLRYLSHRHARWCEPYRRATTAFFGARWEGRHTVRLRDLPWLPVSIFKRLELRSVSADEIFKTVTSSGTTGQVPSRVVLDARTARWQARALVRIGQHFLGPLRRPMVILDCAPSTSDKAIRSARQAGIQGLLQFGHRPFYALNADLSLDVDGLTAYIASVDADKIVFFGFTWLIWQHVVEALRGRRRFALENALLLHSGGWKRMLEQAVDPPAFRQGVQEALGVRTVVDFYGMAEQVGSVFFETSPGCLRASVFSDVLVRDPVTLEVVPDGEVGVIQVLSVLPWSYPGHSILTEDVGRVIPADSSSLHGRCFEVLGRVPLAEVRGCSDTAPAFEGVRS